MADTVLYVRDPKTADLVPIKLIDNGDGTYSLANPAGSAVMGKVRLVTALGDEVTNDIADAVKTLLVSAAGVDAIGEVQATPTAYTLLRRLKDLLTGTILAAGSAIIGRVGHDKTGVEHGVKTVSSAGTDEPLVASSTPAKIVIVQAQTDNTGVIAVGASGVDATVATGTGVLLYAGDSMTLEVDDLADVYVDATVSTDGVRYTYLT
jgi:hypothetical protein